LSIIPCDKLLMRKKMGKLIKEISTGNK